MKWIHDASEKCVRGDDYNLNLTVHHNVIWNCGDVRERNFFAATGCILKGDYNRREDIRSTFTLSCCWLAHLARAASAAATTLPPSLTTIDCFYLRLYPMLPFSRQL